MTTTGMALVATDTLGRLTRFEAVPPQQEAAATGTAAAVDWDKLFAAAAIDRTAFTEVPSSRTPGVYADERRAWTGTYTGTLIPIRIEAAAYRGRPVSFELVGPWTPAPRDSTAPPSPTRSSSLLIIFLLVGAVLAARANLRSGRADVRGAFRLAAFMFTVIMATWLLDGHVRHAQSEMSRFFAATGIALFLGGVMYLIYLGLEPWVRRTSPLVLVGWSRVLAGRLRDPLVGRDVLIGVACGAVGGLLNLIPYVVSRWAGLPEMEPFSSYTGALDGVRPFLRDVVQAMNGSLQSGLITVFEWVSFRMGIELLWNRGVRFRIGCEVRAVYPHPADPLVGDGGGHLLLGLRQLIAHVHEDLVQHLLRILGLRDQVIDVGLEQRRDAVENTHRQRASRYDASSRMCDASARVMLS